mgnify:CR=1 FL=1
MFCCGAQKEFSLGVQKTVAPSGRTWHLLKMLLEEFLNRPEIKLADFAKRVGRHQSVVYRWKRGDTVPNLDIWDTIIRETGGLVTVNDLIPKAKKDAETTGEAA